MDWEKYWEMLENSLDEDDPEKLAEELRANPKLRWEYHSLRQTRIFLRQLPCPELSVDLQRKLQQLSEGTRRRRFGFLPADFFQRPALAFTMAALLVGLSAFFVFNLRQDTPSLLALNDTINQGALKPAPQIAIGGAKRGRAKQRRLAPGRKSSFFVRGPKTEMKRSADADMAGGFAATSKPLDALKAVQSKKRPARPVLIFPANDVVWQIDLRSIRDKKLLNEIQQLLHRNGATSLPRKTKTKLVNGRSEFSVPRQQLPIIRQTLPTKVNKQIVENPSFQQSDKGQARIILISK